MVDESKRAEMNRQDRLQQGQKEGYKPRPKETEFDKALQRTQKAADLLPQAQQPSKTVTEDAIKEAAKREDKHNEDKRRDDDDRKDDRGGRQKGERSEGRSVGEKVVAKGKSKQGGGQGGGGGKQGGFDSSAGRRQLSKLLLKTGAKSLPVDLQGKFAQRVAQSAKGASAAVLTQQVLNAIVQYVRIGINKKGEKEIQIDLHEKIFRGLKLRVIARGGRVHVHFKTADAKGRAAFEKNAGAIREALEKKGIHVDEIVIG